MDMRSPARQAFTTYLKVTRMPVDWLAGAIGQGRSDSTLRSTVDRLDAGVRVKVGRLARDVDLVADGQRRAAAAGQRQKAAQLEVAAEEQRLQATAKLDESRQQAEDRRRQAVEDKAAAVERAEETARASKEVSARTVRAQKASAAGQADALARAQDDKSRTARLAELEEEDSALAARQAALTTEDEARRLRKAASAAKESRTANGSSPA